MHIEANVRPKISLFKTWTLSLFEMDEAKGGLKREITKCDMTGGCKRFRFSNEILFGCPLDRLSITVIQYAGELLFQQKKRVIKRVKSVRQTPI